jgi:tripartite-type tricarboxylate transporter receptor subunit TctC
MLRKILGKVILLTLLCVFVNVAINNSWAADKFPSRYVTILHGYPGGGVVEVTNRLLAMVLQKKLGVNVVAEGKSGGGGVVATNAILTGPSDGYIMGHQSFNSMVQTIFLSKGAVKLDSFKIVCQILGINHALVVTADSPLKTFQDFLDFARKNPGMQWANSGVGNSATLRWENINKLADLKMEGVPFKSDTDVAAAILGKHAPIGVVSTQTARVQSEAGKMRVLFVFENFGLVGLDPKLPNVKTAFPKTIADKDIESVNFIFVQRNTPDDAVKVLEKALEATCKDPEFIEGNAKFGVNVKYLGSQAATAKFAQIFERMKVLQETFSP